LQRHLAIKATSGPLQLYRSNVVRILRCIYAISLLGSHSNVSLMKRSSRLSSVGLSVGLSRVRSRQMG